MAVKAFSLKQIQDKDMQERQRMSRIEDIFNKKKEKGPGKGGRSIG